MVRGRQPTGCMRDRVGWGPGERKTERTCGSDRDRLSGGTRQMLRFMIIWRMWLEEWSHVAKRCPGLAEGARCGLRAARPRADYPSHVTTPLCDAMGGNGAVAGGAADAVARPR
jgi:hypothetical protein